MDIVFASFSLHASRLFLLQRITIYGIKKKFLTNLLLISVQRESPVARMEKNTLCNQLEAVDYATSQMMPPRATS